MTHGRSGVAATNRGIAMNDLKFSDLPETIQCIAAQCLAEVISSSGGGKKEAEEIGLAFIALYEAASCQKDSR